MVIDWNIQYFKVMVLPTLIYGFTAVPIKNQCPMMIEIDKLVLKFVWKCVRPGISITILKKKKVGRFILPGFKK